MTQTRQENTDGICGVFKVSKQFISSMLSGVLKAIIESLRDYVKERFF